MSTPNARQPTSNRARGGFVAAWTGRRGRRERADRDETIQFDGRRAAPRTDRTIRGNESNRNLVETHSRGSFDPSVGPAVAGPPVELRPVRSVSSLLRVEHLPASAGRSALATAVRATTHK